MVRPEVDTLVVFLHWGDENTQCASRRQKELAQMLFEAGADIVVGSVDADRVFGAGRVAPRSSPTDSATSCTGEKTASRGEAVCSRSRRRVARLDVYSWTPARITNGIPIPETGTAETASVAEWENPRACSELTP